MRFQKSYDLLEVYETSMDEKARLIHKVRKDFIEEFTLFNQFYRDISSNLEHVDLLYETDLNDHML